MEKGVSPYLCSSKTFNGQIGVFEEEEETWSSGLLVAEEHGSDEAAENEQILPGRVEQKDLRPNLSFCLAILFSFLFLVVNYEKVIFTPIDYNRINDSFIPLNIFNYI